MKKNRRIAALMLGLGMLLACASGASGEENMQGVSVLGQLQKLFSGSGNTSSGAGTGAFGGTQEVVPDEQEGTEVETETQAKEAEAPAETELASQTEPPAETELTLQTETSAETALASQTERPAEAKLASWTKGASSLQALKAYVLSVTDEASPDYIPEEDRIAVFDLEGTMYGELAPIDPEWWMFVWRVFVDPSFEPDEEMISAAEQVRAAAAARNIPEELRERVTTQTVRAFSGMTLPEYADKVQEFLRQDVWGFEGMTYGEAFYRPMAEVVDYLCANHFTVYIVTEGDRFFCRTLIDGVLPVQKEHVIGTDIVLEASGQEGEDGGDYVYSPEDEVIRTGTILMENTGMNKVARIVQEIGRQPVLCFGNSRGDAGMAAYTAQNNPYKSAVFMVSADDTDRDWADPERGQQLREEWEEAGWHVISMKEDFLTIYGDGVTKTEMPEIEGARPETEPETDENGETPAETEEESEREQDIETIENTGVPADRTEEAGRPEAEDGGANSEPEPREGVTEYEIEDGDNLWGIAAQFLGDGSRYMEIVEANEMEEPYELFPGQILLIPADISADEAEEPAA